MMKPTSQARKRASAILLTMLTAAAMPSGQSGQERKDEALRDERRGMIATSGKNRQDDIKARREYVGMHEKHPFNKSVPATKTPLEAESGQLANREKANGEGRQDVMNQKIDEAGGEEEPRRAAMELTKQDNEAGMGKMVKGRARYRTRRHRPGQAEQLHHGRLPPRGARRALKCESCQGYGGAPIGVMGTDHKPAKQLYLQKGSQSDNYTHDLRRWRRGEYRLWSANIRRTSGGSTLSTAAEPSGLSADLPSRALHSRTTEQDNG